jgi:hypothetical protein
LLVQSLRSCSVFLAHQSQTSGDLKAPSTKLKVQSSKFKVQSSKFKTQSSKHKFMRKPVIAGNWKMYKTLGDAVETALALKPLVANANHCDVVVAPVFTAIKTVADRLEGSNIQVSGQDCSTEVDEGAHTGEVAAFMLRDVGARYVIVGHSERRQLYSETDSMVSRKTQAAVKSGLTAIVCVGESLAQREQGIAENVVAGQLTGGLSGLTAPDPRPYHPRLRTGLGHWHGTYSDAGASARNARVYSARFCGKALHRSSREVADPIRRLCQTRQHSWIDVTT